MLHIFVDADACPVKPEIYRVADRYQIRVTLVSNSWMRIPENPRFHLEVVGIGFDAADDWIVEHLAADDIVITTDVLLASRCIKLNSWVLAPSGKLFTEDNIGQTVATRDLLAELRGAGEITGGPAAMTDKDRNRFLQQLHQIVQNIQRSPGKG